MQPVKVTLIGTIVFGLIGILTGLVRVLTDFNYQNSVAVINGIFLMIAIIGTIAWGCLTILIFLLKL
jgi:hypothetical protein